MADCSPSFRNFEHAGWQKAAEGYPDAFGDLTSQAIPALLEAVGAKAGMRLLDVATGPGYVAAAAAERGASVVAVDFSAAMVALACRRYPAVEFREGDAEELPFPAASFDAAVMNFGLLHLGQPQQALAEIHRVLRSKGRVGFTVWSPPEEAVGFGIVLKAVESHGQTDIPLPLGPPFFRFSDFEECRRLLLGAGFRAPEMIRVQQVWRPGQPDAVFEAFYRSSVRTAALLRAQSEEALDAIRTAIRNAVLAYTIGGPVELPMPAVLASATKV